MRVQLIGILCLILIGGMSWGLEAETSANTFNDAAAGGEVKNHISADAEGHADDTIGIRDICNEYIEAWKQFYPSRAFSRGFLESIYDFDDYSKENRENWLAYNKKILNRITQKESNLSLDDRIDARLLKTQIRSEIDGLENESPHKNSPALYSRAISQAVRGVFDSDLLMPNEKVQLITTRLTAVNKLCSSAIKQLKEGSPDSIASTLKSLEESAQFYKDKLPEMIAKWPALKNPDTFSTQCLHTASQILRLISHIEQNVTNLPQTSPNPILGRDTFARKLRLAIDSDLTPEKLESMALEEIHTVRELMAKAATSYLTETYPNIRIPNDQTVIINLALKDMEQSHPASEQGYLTFWKELSQKAEDFIRTHKIITLPDNQTLSITLAPESAGPRTRIGWVSSAPPFHPNPWTTIFLPTIPDSFPEKERTEFWQSFNNYFTRFIVIHELFPGHYIQNKINRENPHPVRRLFPYALYSEGWATLCEKVALDAGWDNNHKLTHLAQLRKRLENANRAYTSVQSHCRSWDQKKVHNFSINTSLLAPQFAKSLWGRLMSSPMQITTYFLGTQQFTALLENEKKRQGDKFSTLDFMDTILRAGPIPLDEFPQIFKNKY